VPPGFVLEQNPPAARGVKGGRQISVILSGGTETVRVPELTGKSARQAIVLLDGAGLGFGSVSRCPSSRVPAGAVIACTPPAGAVLERGRRVDVLESLGLPELRFMMPDLTGRDEDVVRRKLESLGLSVLLSRQFSPSGQAGPWAVVRQQPSRGTIVCEGDTVRLIARAR
jgi:serine/threonine-protein kinase